MADIDLRKIASAAGMGIFGDEEVCGVVPTGCAPLDAIFGGGFHLGRLTEIFGEEGHGKSTLAASAISTVQDQGGVAALSDSEGAAYKGWLESCRIKWQSLLYNQPDTVEEVFGALDKFLKALYEDPKLKTTPSAFIWDSLAATSTKAEMEAGFEDQNIALQARILSKLLRITARTYSQKPAVFIVTNQTRSNIGERYGSRFTTSGGKAIRFYASLRIQVSRKAILYENGVAVGILAEAMTVKNKLSAPFRRALFPILFKSGIDDVMSWFYNLDARGLAPAGGPYRKITLPSGDVITFHAKDFIEKIKGKEAEIRQYVIDTIDTPFIKDRQPVVAE